LGPWSAYGLVAGTMIGTGIFFFVSPVAANAGSPAGIVVAWIAGIAIASCGALCVAELATVYPATGGVYVFLREAFGELAGFLYVWANFFILRIGNLAIATLAFATFACDALGVSPETAASLQRPVAIAALALVTVVNLVGVRTGATVQVTLTALKLLALAGLVALGVAFAQGLLPPYPIEVAPLVDQTPAFGLALALVPIMWTLGGWDESPFVAEEVRDPERNLPRSVLAGLWSVGILYVLVNLAYLAILTPMELAGSGTRTATLAMERALGPAARALLSCALMVSTLGAANGQTLTGARIGYAAGRDHPTIGWLAQLGARSGAPARALLAQAGLTLTTLVVLDDPMSLLLYTAVAYWLFGGLTAAALIVVRPRLGDRRPGFRVPLHPVAPVVFVVASGAMAVTAAVESPRGALVTAAIAAAGLAGFWLDRRLRTSRA
jgi:amino acid transporter